MSVDKVSLNKRKKYKSAQLLVLNSRVAVLCRVLLKVSLKSSPLPRAHGAMGHRIDPSWGGHIEPFLVPASAPRLV